MTGSCKIKVDLGLSAQSRREARGCSLVWIGRMAAISRLAGVWEVIASHGSVAIRRNICTMFNAAHGNL